MLLSDHERSRDTVTITKEQFDKIIELLTPGYELSKLFLEQHQAKAAAPEPANDSGAQTT